MAKSVIYKIIHSSKDGEKVNLNNGDIILVREGEKILMVVSHTDPDNSHPFCSIVDLKNGGRICPEHISRRIIMWELLKHLRIYAKNQTLSAKDIKIINHNKVNIIIEGDE